MAPYVLEDSQGSRLKVRLTPRASREGIDGTHGDAVKIKVKAPPVDGRANEALLKFLADILGIGRGSLEMVSGQTSRSKTIRILGLSPDEVLDRLGLG